MKPPGSENQTHTIMKAIVPWMCSGVLGLAMLATAAPSSPAAGGVGNGSFRVRIIEKLRGLRSDLDLTDTQRDEIRKVLSSHREEIRHQWETGRGARENMRETVNAHGVESAEAKAAASRIGDAARDRALLVARIATEIKPLLNADQIRKLQSARSEIEEMIDQAASR